MHADECSEQYANRRRQMRGMRGAGALNAIGMASPVAAGERPVAS